jgi:uncharacterized protein YndB with AHSA1/START domain
MRWVVIALGVLIALVMLVVLIGWALPVKHHVTREATYAASPAQLFALITDVEAFPLWRPKVKSVHRDTSAQGRTRFRETGSDGTILFEVDREVPDQQLITRIADPKLPFGGTWTFDILPADAGRTTLRITEDGEVYSPVFRFVSRFVLGHHATIEVYLRDVAKRFAGSRAMT